MLDRSSTKRLVLCLLMAAALAASASAAAPEAASASAAFPLPQKALSAGDFSALQQGLLRRTPDLDLVKPLLALSTRSKSTDGSIEPDDLVIAIDGRPIDAGTTHPEVDRCKEVTIRRAGADIVLPIAAFRSSTWGMSVQIAPLAWRRARDVTVDRVLITAAIAAVHRSDYALMAAAAALQDGADPATCWAIATVACHQQRRWPDAIACARRAFALESEPQIRNGLAAMEMNAMLAGSHFDGVDTLLSRATWLATPAQADALRARAATAAPATSPLARLAALPKSSTPLPLANVYHAKATLCVTSDKNVAGVKGTALQFSPAGTDAVCAVAITYKHDSGKETGWGTAVLCLVNAKTQKERFRIHVNFARTIEVSRTALLPYRLPGEPSLDFGTTYDPPPPPRRIELAVCDGWVEGAVDGQRVLLMPTGDKPGTTYLGNISLRNQAIFNELAWCTVGAAP